MPDADDKIDQESGQGGGENFPQLALQMLPGKLAQLAKGLGQGERVEEVVPHPGPQCDVPAPPEVGQGGGEQRAAEVLRQVDAEQPGHPAGDVNAAGEIPVQLNTVEENTHRENAAAVRPGVVQHGVHQHSGPVRNHHLFEIPPKDQLDAVL